MDKIPTSWPFQEAGKIKQEGLDPEQPVIFEAGFGPSGRPHIGTFAEVARTIMVQNSFQELNPGRSTKLYVFCDDMDGLRKVPGNVPEQEMLREHLGRPLYKIPDPFGTDESYSAHMENELARFLARFGFDFELKSSAVEYGKGVFNEALRRVLERYDQIREVVLPTLQEENREQWSPIIPLCENCGRLYTTVVIGRDLKREAVTYQCRATFGQGKNQIQGCGHQGEVGVMDGRVKVGWKVDWALHWFAYRVRYEMYGKDLIDSARLSARITRILGGEPPGGMVYEMFLEESGKKISKSVGQGLTVDSWLTYAPVESLLYYLYQNPKKQRRLYFDVIPKSVDDYLEELRKYPGLPEAEKMNRVAWHLEKIKMKVPAYTGRINFSLMLNLISAIGAGDRDLLREYSSRYDPEADQNREILDQMVDRAMLYFRDFIEPTKKYRKPKADERPWFESLLKKLGDYQGDDENEYQALVFDVARELGAKDKAVFRALYEVLLGQERGPRFGTFVKLVGKKRAMEMIERALA